MSEIFNREKNGSSTHSLQDISFLVSKSTQTWKTVVRPVYIVSHVWHLSNSNWQVMARLQVAVHLGVATVEIKHLQI